MPAIDRSLSVYSCRRLIDLSNGCRYSKSLTGKLDGEIGGNLKKAVTKWLVWKMMNLGIQNEQFCIKTEKLCIQNDDFCIKNDDFCIKNDEF